MADRDGGADHGRGRSRAIDECANVSLPFVHYIRGCLVIRFLSGGRLDDGNYALGKGPRYPQDRMQPPPAGTPSASTADGGEARETDQQHVRCDWLRRSN
jgi:hypothetical protein